MPLTPKKDQSHSWYRMYKQLEAFRKQSKGAWPSKYSANLSEKKFAAWCHGNIELHKQGLLSLEHADLLRSLLKAPKERTQTPKGAK